MAFLARFRIGQRLIGAFGAVVLLLLAGLVVNLVSLHQTQLAVDTMLGEQAERLALAKEWRENIVVNSQRALALGLSTDNSLHALFDEQMKGVSARTTVIQKRFAEIETTARGTELQRKLAEVRTRYLDTRTVLLKAKADGDSAKAQELGNSFKVTTVDYIAAAAELVQHQEGRNTELGGRAQARVQNMRLACLLVAGLSIALAVLLGLVLTRSITAPLARAEEAATRIAAGNLRGDIAAPGGRCETAHLLRALASMQGSLRRVVGKVREAADSIQVASSEVATGNQDLSQRTEQAASNLQQSASAIEELSVTVRNAAQAASSASERARSASDVAQRGNAVVGQVVATMDQINDSSRRIGDIISVIDGIAFQTNILALNAAVEAARAGEQGRGFAVVAGEVRSLAQRSAEAAREIKSLIGTSVERVASGSRLVGEAGTTMAELLSSVQEVSGIVGGISDGASQQSLGIDDVNRSVTELDQMTQQNAALVEESAAAAESLRGQAQALSATVAIFQLP